MISCEKKLNGYVNLKRTVGYQSTKIGKFACYILACLSSCLITEWLPDLHSGTKWYIGHTVSCFAGSVFTSMIVNLFCTGCRTGDVERKDAVDSGCGIDVQLV